MYVCKSCRCPYVQKKIWVYLNKPELEVTTNDFDSPWCPQCVGFVELDVVEEINLEVPYGDE